MEAPLSPFVLPGMSKADIVYWRNVIEALLPAEGGTCSEEDVRAWLQCPTQWNALAASKNLDKDQAPGIDNDCTQRAMVKLPAHLGGPSIQAVSGFDDAKFCRKQINLVSGLFSIKSRVLSHGAMTHLKVGAGELGASESVFKGSNGFHYVIVIGVRELGEQYCIAVLDPDVSATAESRQAWNAALADEECKNLASSATSRCSLLRRMLLGTAGGVGALVRFHRLTDGKLWDHL